MTTATSTTSQTTSHRLRAVATPLVLAVVFLAGWYWADHWQLDRAAVEDGRWWLLISGQFTHQTVSHGLSNFVAVLVAAAVAPIWLNRWPGLLLVLGLALGVGVGVWLNNPEIDIYRGFSGVGHGWLMIAFAWSPFMSPWFKVLVLAGIQLKVIWEDSTFHEFAQFSGYFSDAEVLTDAHWYGVLLAIPVVIAFFAVRTYRDRVSPE